MKNLKYLVIFLIILISSFITYHFLTKFIQFNNNWLIIIEKEIMIKPEIIVENIDNENNLEIIKDINNKISTENEYKVNKDDFYKMSYKDKDFLLSNDSDSYKYWFISKQIKDNIMYLYSHNSYKYTENSGYYLYNNLKYWDIIKFNDNEEYKVVKSNIIDFEQENVDIIKPLENVDIVYFTCTPHWENIRKIYQLQKIDIN